MLNEIFIISMVIHMFYRIGLNYYPCQADSVGQAVLSSSCVQVSPWDKREEANEKKQHFAVANSDHLALLQAYKV